MQTGLLKVPLYVLLSLEVYISPEIKFPNFLGSDVLNKGEEPWILRSFENCFILNLVSLSFASRRQI